MTEVKDGWYPKVEPQNKGRIAVIGSGPAGLTVARNLALDGYEVKIFDHSVIGGMLTQSIPDFRLPPEVPQREIEEVKKLGITIENGHLGSDFTLKDLLEEYSAVFLSIGAHKDQMMRIPGEDLDGVYQALHFLKDIKQGKKISFEGKKVIVVGGGNVAMDVARTARRLKGEVKIVYRRAWEQMPADEEEIRGAEEEGVEFNLLVNPVEILGKGKVEGIRCIRMELGEPDESGRRRPVPIKGSEFEMEADIFIEAIGEVPEGDKLEPMGLKVTSWGSIEVDENMRTNIEGVFAAGDAVTGAATVIEAVAGAIKAAEAIKEYCEKRRRLVRA
jgi:glutamate synthase (NADPH/NADH) small chain